MQLTKEEINACVEKAESLQADRTEAESVWRQVRDYMLPNRPSFTTDNEDTNAVMANIFDGTAIDAINVSKAGINGMLTNAALPWYSIEMENQELNKDENIRQALQEVNSVMPVEFHNSNFYTNIDVVYEEAIGYGQSCIFIIEGKKTALNFHPVPLKNVFTEEDSDGNIDTVYRCFQYTKKQIVQKWGEDALSTQMRASKDDKKKYRIIHAVYPRKDREVTSKGEFKDDKYNKKFVSVYIEKEEKHIFDEGGYDEFPYAVPRLFLAEDGYGRGMGCNALPDVKMLNSMEKTGLRAWQKAVDPPTQGPDEGTTLPIKTGPGGHTYNSNWDKPGSEIKTLYPSGTFQNLPTFEQKCEAKRNQIREFFFYKQFRTQQEGQPRTAQEIIQIASENLKILGPLLNRFTEELLKPIISRSFSILLRAGRFPKLAQLIAQGQIQTSFKIVYLSPIAKAQRLYEAQELQNALNLLIPAAQVDQTILDNFDGDKYFQKISGLYPVVTDIARSEDQKLGIRNARAEAQANAQAQANAMATVEGLKTASETEPDTGLLGALSGNVGMQ
ncbi:MAG: portal protein [Clostridia bacterium]|jgi:hypothetical protein